ncbi:MAG: hypothetical protein ACI9VS_000740 [Candidatus Binatia bacterium]|jgi:hypothetical protein
MVTMMLITTLIPTALHLVAVIFSLAGHPVGGFLYDCATASGEWAPGYSAY